MTKTNNQKCLPNQDEDKFVKMIRSLGEIFGAYYDLNENLKDFIFALGEMSENMRKVGI